MHGIIMIITINVSMNIYKTYQIPSSNDQQVLIEEYQNSIKENGTNNC